METIEILLIVIIIALFIAAGYYYTKKSSDADAAAIALAAAYAKSSSNDYGLPPISTPGSTNNVSVNNPVFMSNAPVETAHEKKVKEIINRYDKPAFPVVNYADVELTDAYLGNVNNPANRKHLLETDNRFRIKPEVLNGWWLDKLPPSLTNNNRYLNKSSIVYASDGTYIRHFMFQYVATRLTRLTVYSVADNSMEFYVNGSMQFSRKDFEGSHTPDTITLPAGLNAIEVVLTNLGGMGGFMIAAYNEQNKLEFNTLTPGWKTISQEM